MYLGRIKAHVLSRIRPISGRDLVSHWAGIYFHGEYGHPWCAHLRRSITCFATKIYFRWSFNQKPKIVIFQFQNFLNNLSNSFRMNFISQNIFIQNSQL